MKSLCLALFPALLFFGCSSENDRPPPADTSFFETTPEIHDACSASCEAAWECGIDSRVCRQNCEEWLEGFDGACLEAAIEETHCRAELPCEEALFFGLVSPSHAECGGAVVDVRAACAPSSDVATTACASFCGSSAACEPPNFPDEDSCLAVCEVKTTWLAGAESSACADAVANVYACLAELPCGDVALFLNTEYEPPECEAQLAAVTSTCE